MLPLLALLSLQTSSTSPVWQIESGLAIQGLTQSGRVPVLKDALVDSINSGTFVAPTAGETINDKSGRPHKWQKVVSKKTGILTGDVLEGAYLFTTYESDKDCTLLLTASGDGAVYVNGELRAGDVYGYGYLTLPVEIKRGTNNFLFTLRGDLSARLDQPVAEAQLSTGDMTLPDILPTDKRTLLGAVPVINSSQKEKSDLELVATLGTKSIKSKLAQIQPMTFRKEAFSFPIPDDDTSTELKLALIEKGKTLSTATVKVERPKPGASYRRTFVSKVDNSVQYFAVTPPPAPDPSNALILTLHGASVEAIGQARAYAPKDWATIVAPTNRRPYGFDWEDIGRIDALEVLDLAKKNFPHDPRRIALVGHSMGGHGTWSIGSLYPNLFAAIAPSAGWISFQSYAGGLTLKNPTPTEQVLLDAADASDTLARAENLKAEQIYILHGDVDDNVPVTEARHMRDVLTGMEASFSYHEQPGANHWWGNQCVDWPPLMNLIEKSYLPAADAADDVDFLTPNPGISSTLRWLTVLQQEKPGQSEVKLSLKDGVILGKTRNVAALTLRSPAGEVTGLELDGAKFSADFKRSKAMTFRKVGGHWLLGAVGSSEKNPLRTGPFKLALQNHLVFVYGTKGSREEARACYNLARYYAETFEVRGNGSVDLLPDTEWLHKKPGGNVLLFGNKDQNSAWTSLLGSTPFAIGSGALDIGGREWKGQQYSALVCYPRAGSTKDLVDIVGATGTLGFKSLERLPIFSSGLGYPDWTAIDGEHLGDGLSSVLADGSFSNSWK